MMPQLIKSTAFVVATAFDPFLVVFSLQLPCESQTVSFVSLWQFAPGALQSIVGKLGKWPLFGWLMSFHCAAPRAIKQSNVNKSSLFMFKLFLVLCTKKKKLFHSALFTFEQLELLWTNEQWTFFYRSFCDRRRARERTIYSSRCSNLWIIIFVRSLFSLRLFWVIK